MPTYITQLPGPIGITETLTHLRLRNAPGEPLDWNQLGEKIADSMRTKAVDPRELAKMSVKQAANLLRIGLEEE